MRILILLIAVAVLGGCATPAQRAAQLQREVDEMITVYGPSCEKLGYKTDSDPWRDCILHLSAKESYERDRGAPRTTSCIGHRGFMQCTTF
ncbi:hypothetical protein SKTS_08120 [Sulfurimicrobium lacus]|uniref:Lipoprotein n=1 Tax=Sulfurimicrobium lacus TaxID=2715678 RepID=A0A6F8VA98_9PROT|nr:hypothetical protein SKTS_08120 [Sulfurimicrobium lacus]